MCEGEKKIFLFAVKCVKNQKWWWEASGWCCRRCHVIFSIISTSRTYTNTVMTPFSNFSINLHAENLSLLDQHVLMLLKAIFNGNFHFNEKIENFYVNKEKLEQNGNRNVSKNSFKLFFTWLSNIFVEFLTTKNSKW